MLTKQKKTHHFRDKMGTKTEVNRTTTAKLITTLGQQATT